MTSWTQWLLAFDLIDMQTGDALVLGLLPVVVLVSVFLAHKTIKLFDLRQLTFPSFLYLMYLFFVAVPSLLIYIDQSGPSRHRFIVGVLSGLVTLPMGYLLINAATRSNRAEVTQYFQRPTDNRPMRPGLYATFLFGSLVITLLYFIETPHVPIVELFRNQQQTTDVLRMREEAFDALESPLVYTYSVLREMLYPYLVCVSFGNLIVRKKQTWLLLFLVSFTVAILYGAASTAKGPVAEVIMLLACFLYLHKRGRVGIRLICTLIILVLLFPVLIMWLLLPNVSLSTAAEVIFVHRLFEGPNTVTYHYFEVFPDAVPYLYGRGIGKVALLTGREYFNVPHYILKRIYPHNTLQSGSAGGMFLAAFYADFGWTGVILGGLLAGLTIQGIQVYLIRARKTVENMAAYAFMYYACCMLQSRPLPTVLLSTGVVFALLIARIIEALASPRPVAKGTLSAHA